MRPVFISYRREDTEGQAGRLFTDLREAFGAEAVFMDVATIEPGVDFRRAIEKHTTTCAALLAVIGRNWLNAKDKSGKRRLDDPNDFVRLETAAALKRDIPVIPVLVQDAVMVTADDLPDDLKNLAFRNAVELTHARWDSDVQLLVKALTPLVNADGGQHAPTPQGWNRTAAIAGSAVLAAVLAVAGIWMFSAGESPTADQADAQALVSSQVPNAEIDHPSNDTPGVDASVATAGDKPPVSNTPTIAPSGSQAPPTNNNAEITAPQDARDALAAIREEQARLAADRAALEEQRRQDAAARDAAQQAAQQAAAQEEAERAAREREQLMAAELERKRKAREREEAARAHAAGICVNGFVWREARPGDIVCVTPDIRERTASENAAADARRQPGGGAYGPNTCMQGYVWREAFEGDLVCVDPSSRTQARQDNELAARRVVPENPNAPAAPLLNSLN